MLMWLSDIYYFHPYPSSQYKKKRRRKGLVIYGYVFKESLNRGGKTSGLKSLDLREVLTKGEKYTLRNRSITSVEGKNDVIFNG